MKYPAMRNELLSYLKDLSNWDYQNDCWVNGKCPYGVEHDELDYAIHFLFDDTVLSDDPESLIGVFLRNKEEADSIRSLCNELQIVFEKYGTELSDREYINLVEWKDVLMFAQLAFRKLSGTEIQHTHNPTERNN
ncbi:SCO4402 family protein [Zooshikella harenae]|uniref:CdiI immunity protein domain-containing protein n=1 Tax=Zooshikella harenae TaxID=2827238 RepID=A0ABS5ZLF2_9GAMM|nr:hypothetical protein [Zooshikella harenae]MBU2714241.1 hypothetical protein [Zooshikella harenae]